MTAAVCLRCGEFKTGALTRCPRCSHEPTSPEERAKHVLVSDRFFSLPQLEDASLRIKRGETLAYPPEELSSLTRTLTHEDLSKNAKWFVFLFMLAFAAVFLALILGVAFTIHWIRHGSS